MGQWYHEVQLCMNSGGAALLLEMWYAPSSEETRSSVSHFSQTSECLNEHLNEKGFYTA